jgi:hypothetical protein
MREIEDEQQTGMNEQGDGEQCDQRGPGGPERALSLRERGRADAGDTREI